jgi:hypothetical protein
LGAKLKQTFPKITGNDLDAVADMLWQASDTVRKLERVTEQQAMAEAEAMAEPDADEQRAGIARTAFACYQMLNEGQIPSNTPEPKDATGEWLYARDDAEAASIVMACAARALAEA